MDALRSFLVILTGVVTSFGHDWISVSTLEVTARPGDNVTLFCDCKMSPGVYIAWFRNCSHTNQPPLILNTKNRKHWTPAGILALPRFELVKNFSSDSYDLLIMNVTNSDEGLYYCGTEKKTVEDKDFITTRHIYRYSNITTRIIINPEPELRKHSPNCGQCWMMLFTLCPAVVVLSSLVSSFSVHHLCHKKS